MHSLAKKRDIHISDHGITDMNS